MCNEARGNCECERTVALCELGRAGEKMAARTK